MRSRLGVRIEAEDLDSVAGARGSRQPVEHESVLAMRAAHPDDPLEQIAHRLGCSLSTVKRHLRRARRASAGDPSELPSLDEVFDAFDEVVESRIPRPAR